MVAIEKNPKTNAEIAENPKAKTFLNFSCLINDTTDNSATTSNKRARTIVNPPFDIS